MAGRKRQTLVEKAKEVVDHIIHPNSLAAEKAVEPKAEKKAKKSSPENSDYASHPKFAKFKSIQGAE